MHKSLFMGGSTEITGIPEGRDTTEMYPWSDDYALNWYISF